MKLRLLLASAVAATALMVGSSPASADVDACAGAGTATLSNFSNGTGFGLPGSQIPAPSADFSLNLTGACVSGATTVTATGKVNGYCGSSSGHGVATVSHPHAAPQDHQFAFVSAGTVLEVTGQVVGTVTAVDDPLDADSCVNTTASTFNIQGEASFNHIPCTRAGVTTPNGTYSAFVCL